MTHSEIIKELSLRLNTPQVEVRRLLQISTEKIKNILDKDFSLTLPGLGTFFTSLNQRRKGFNPRINRFILLPPKRRVRFHPSSTLKDELKYKRH